MLKDTIANDIKNAMRDQNKGLLFVLRSIMAAVKQVEIDERIIASDDRMLIILDKLAKQRRESIAQYTKGNRQDLVDTELYELAIIQSYLPKALTNAELIQIINTAIQSLQANSIKDMSKIINAIKPTIQGKCDMSQVSNIIKERLNHT